MTSPISFLREAIKAVPAVKYALGIGGIVAVVAIVGAFGIEPRVAVIGAVVMLLLMAILVIFARLTGTAGTRLHAPAMVFTWFSLIMFMAISICLLTSVFFKVPVDLSCWLSDKYCGEVLGDRLRLNVDEITYGSKSPGTDYASASLNVESISDEPFLIEYVSLLILANEIGGKDLISNSYTLIEDRMVASGGREQGTLEAENGVYWIHMGQPASAPKPSQNVGIQFVVESQVKFLVSGEKVRLSVKIPSPIPLDCGHPCLGVGGLNISAGSARVKECAVFKGAPPSPHWVYDCKVPEIS